MKKADFFSCGKLLLSGEYLVLDGAKALALPTRLGQHLNVRENGSNLIKWVSYTVHNEVWFAQDFRIDGKEITPVLELKSTTETAVQRRLLQLFSLILEHRSAAYLTGYSFSSKLDFPRNWGLGSSSTLIQNLADWTGIDRFDLLDQSFGGSGYDLACAHSRSPVFFRRKPTIKIETTTFKPSFSDHLFFVHLNKKQNSREAIKQYRQQNLTVKEKAMERVSALSEKMATAESLSEFEGIIDAHETILSGILNQARVKQRLFPDFPGSVKSLGAWGGDFVLATGNKAPEYFAQKGYSTILGFDELFDF